MHAIFSRLVGLSLLLMFLSVGQLSAQDVIVYDISLDTLKELIEENEDFIESTNQKLLSADSTLMEADYFLLYYGTAYGEKYTPYTEGMVINTIHQTLDEGNYDLALTMTTDLLTKNPGSAGCLYLMGIIHNELGDTTTSGIFFDRFYSYMAVPFYSGDGKSEETAFVVRSVDDEYIIMAEMGYRVESQALIRSDLGIPYDLLSGKDRQTGKEVKVYFNVAQPFLYGMGGLDDKKSEKDKDKKSAKAKKEKKKKKGKKKKDQ